MNALPLIHRELLVGARLRSTYWLRLAMAAGSTLLGAILLLAITKGRFITGLASPGMALFSVLVWLGLATTGLFGVFFAADTISSERRESTLGLLFLTGLRAYEVVIAKLGVTTLRSGFTLLAALPVIALPLLLGGVTFRSYGLVALVLGNTLFLSVSVGLAVSAFSRKPVRAVLSTLFVMIGFVGVTVWLDMAIAGYRDVAFKPYASLVSPGYALYVAAFAGSGEIWLQLGLQHLCAWLLLGAATFGTGRLTERIRQPSRKPIVRWLRGAAETGADRRRRDRRPVQWLVQRHNRLPTILALSILGGVGVWSTVIVLHDNLDFWQVHVLGTLTALSGLFEFVIIIWLAAESARLTGDARREGALELMLATPLQVHEIIRGFWRGLGRVFGPALLVILFLWLFAQTLGLLQTYENMFASPGSPGPVNRWEYFHFQLANAVFGITNTIALFAAVGWVGLWLGLRMERPAPAIAVTWVLTTVAPTLLRILIEIFGAIVSMRGTGIAAQFYSVLCQGIAGILIQCCFIIWARRNLLCRFRTAANGTLRKLRPGRAT